MITERKRKLEPARPERPQDVARDPSARFVHDLATKPPMKDVASLKAASDVFDASDQRGRKTDHNKTDHKRR